MTGDLDATRNEAGPDADVISALLSRRAILNAGLLATGGFLVPGAALLEMSPATAAPSAPVVADKFLTASNYLIQHHLSPETGQRLAPLLSKAIPTLDADLGAIIATARARNATAVEDFFEALPAGQVQETAHRIIFGWYAGVVDDSPTAQVVAFEDALMYQPTKDAVAVPTYSFNGPDNWTDFNPPLSAMPTF